MFEPRDSTIRVAEFSLKECPRAPNSGPPLFTFAQFHALRNEVLSILCRYGTVGPNGSLRIQESVEQECDVWYGDGSHLPEFYVVSDIWNFWSRWIRIEGDLQRIRPPLLDELTMALSPRADWCFYLALGKGGLTVFYNRILYEGAAFAGARSVDDIYRRCKSDNSL